MMADKGFAIVDAGGTNYRIALYVPGKGLTHIREYPCEDFADPGEIIKKYKQDENVEFAHCVKVLAGVTDDPEHFSSTNVKHWRELNLARIFGDIGVKLYLYNDFLGQGASLLEMVRDNLVEILPGADPKPAIPSELLRLPSEAKAAGGGKLKPTPNPFKRWTIIGPGTGLGVATIFADDENSFQILDGEGGHDLFTPHDDYDERVVKRLTEMFNEEAITYEQLCSGPGLERIYKVVCDLAGVIEASKEAKEIAQLAADGDGLALDTINLFTKVLGQAAANAALVNKTRGGIFIAGGIIPKLKAAGLFNEEVFRKELVFNDLDESGNNFMTGVPVYLVEDDKSGLKGAQALGCHLLALG